MVTGRDASHGRVWFGHDTVWVYLRCAVVMVASFLGAPRSSVRDLCLHAWGDERKGVGGLGAVGYAWLGFCEGCRRERWCGGDTVWVSGAIRWVQAVSVRQLVVDV